MSTRKPRSGPRPYAEETKVEAAQSIREIRDLVKSYGGKGWTEGDYSDLPDHPHYFVQWEMEGLLLRWTVRLPQTTDFKTRPYYSTKERTAEAERVERARAQEERRRWRACLISIKGTLVHATSPDVVFEEEVWGHVVSKADVTMGQYARDLRKTMPPGQWLPEADKILRLPAAQPMEGQYRVIEEG